MATSRDRFCSSRNDYFLSCSDLPNQLGKILLGLMNCKGGHGWLIPYQESSV
jgi:hypothetical protein